MLLFARITSKPRWLLFVLRKCPNLSGFTECLVSVGGAKKQGPAEGEVKR